MFICDGWNLFPFYLFKQVESLEDESLGSDLRRLVPNTHTH
jgi:hypothetical protein